MMKFIETTLKGAYLVDLHSKNDDRGSFTRMFCQKELTKIGFDKQVMQTNHSITKKKGTLRGMHYMVAPATEVKMLRVMRGEIYDVIVDLRPESDTFLEWTSYRLSEARPQLLYVPEGFAHGFQSLVDGVEMIYHHSAVYNPVCERGFRHDDQKFGITWPLAISVMSQRDKDHNEYSFEPKRP